MNGYEVSAADLRRGYGPIYRRLSRCGQDMHNNTKIVLLNLLERLGQNVRVWPAQQTIGADCDLGDRQVRAALRELESRGFISSYRRGQGKPNAYEINLPQILQWADPRTGKNAVLEPSMLPVSPIEGSPKEDPPKKVAASRKEITDQCRQEMATKYPELNEPEEYEGAINHTGYLKAVVGDIYYRRWMKRADQWRQERRQGGGRNGNSSRRDTRDPQAFVSGPAGRRNVRVFD